ncbi:hypothetical protein K450DRAFT_249633 [Umbelopsis ramanniana AG]|uniref:Large ribosomal subunit protein mL50 n=1 Tax=Umbelopsis ramanniana AG TaxID=1314678 RepID=A0AAD5E7R5_UMBRA|nr:uncharacterized protein K450DRAFT_249633 [Umbelopsis ramanniana AG]KAI8577865.1 hypothetical protein K450DRAFT_249633 [Umbelopsis ramanniana AG]
MIRSSVPFVRAYPLLRTRYTAALHTSAVWRMEKSAVVSNWNPFAKKQQEEQKPDQQLQNAVDKVDLNFNVEYQDKEDIPSWKSKVLMNDAEEVEKTLKEIVQKHVKDINESSWSEISLADTTLKFNIIKDAIVETGKDVPSAELNNITTVLDALAFFSRKAVSVDDKRGAVQRFFEEDIEEVPSNLAFKKLEKHAAQA